LIHLTGAQRYRGRKPLMDTFYVMNKDTMQEFTIVKESPLLLICEVVSYLNRPGKPDLLGTYNGFTRIPKFVILNKSDSLHEKKLAPWYILKFFDNTTENREKYYQRKKDQIEQLKGIRTPKK
jgi:hypothetical protein